MTELSRHHDELWEYEIAILRVVERMGDPSMLDIVQAVTTFTSHTIRAGVRNLVRRGYLRMTEDSVEHEWTYRLNSDSQAREREEKS